MQLTGRSVFEHFGETTQQKSELEFLKPDSVFKKDEAENLLKFKSKFDYEGAEVLKRGGSLRGGSWF